MNIQQLKVSKFLARGDVQKPILVTIKAITSMNVAREDDPPEHKYVLEFTDCGKPMVLNWTNTQLIAKFLNSEETDHWIGKKIVVYDDPSITFGGKLVGGLRVRAPRNQPAPAPASQPAPAPAPVAYEDPGPSAVPEDDDVPF